MDLSWLETLPISIWVAESDWGYPLMLSIHSIGMAAVVGLMLVLDFRTLGLASRVPIAPLRSLMPFAWIGFFVNLVSGLLLFGSTATRLSSNWPFLLKMGCIVLAGAVTYLLWRELKWQQFGERDDFVATKRAKQIAIASIVLWTLATVFGRLIAYVLDHAILSGEA